MENSSDDTVFIQCVLHPNKVYRFGAAESYYFINIPIVVVNSFLLVFIVLGNTTVILAYFRDKSLQSVPNMLLITLAFTDLFVGLIAQPLFLVILLRDVVGAEPLCWLALLSSVSLKFCGGASLMTLSLLISLERYLAICHPFKHRRWITKRRVKQAVFTLCSFLLVLTCSLLFGIESDAYLPILTIFTFAAIAITAFACCSILWTLKTRRERHVSVEDIGTGRMRSHSAASVASNQVGKLDYKIVVTMFYITAALVVCYTPMFAAIVYAQVRSRDRLYLKYLYPNVMTLVFLNSLLNPVIYCLRNRRFTSAIRKLSDVTSTGATRITQSRLRTATRLPSSFRLKIYS